MTDGDAVVAVANRLMDRFDVVVATQDWHPSGHGSFASVYGREPGEVAELNGLVQVLWPDHCVQGTAGAEFVKGLDVGKINQVFQKGIDPAVDSYSGFFDNGRRGDTGLGAWLKAKGVTAVTVVGLATDYCVKFTALDAVAEGFDTTLVAEGIRGVELNAGDCEKAMREMEKAGVTVVDENDLAERTK